MNAYTIAPETLVRITADKHLLWVIGGEEYANKHAGMLYVATIDKDEWAIVSGAKFPPDAFTNERH